MELKEYLHIVKKRWLLILSVTLVSIFIAALASFLIIKPTYKADISVIVGNSQEANANKQNYNDVIMYQKLVKTYSEFTKTRLVSEDVINELGLSMTPDKLLSMVSVAPKGDTEFITISVKSKKPAEARDIANQLAKSLKKVSNEVKKADNVQLVDEAVLPTSPASPKPFLNMGIAFVLGIFISVGIVFLIEYLDNTVKSSDEIEKMLDIPVIGAIPMVVNETEKKKRKR
ncbi:YveK family protein [Clostridium hydrogeniformans]|uniref:YveK family protein n=1 Tax=Clostridium hydrogeniformans TaxID=349933 RepID=UPI00048141C2|nr:Wzz/FepE/Etk N-terminal domain-containing protein [Clostridium hydrogeniformans]